MKFQCKQRKPANRNRQCAYLQENRLLYLPKKINLQSYRFAETQETHFLNDSARKVTDYLKLDSLIQLPLQRHKVLNLIGEEFQRGNKVSPTYLISYASIIHWEDI